jgi:hypothetical protein
MNLPPSISSSIQFVPTPSSQASPFLLLRGVESNNQEELEVEGSIQKEMEVIEGSNKEMEVMEGSNQEVGVMKGMNQELADSIEVESENTKVLRPNINVYYTEEDNIEDEQAAIDLVLGTEEEEDFVPEVHDEDPEEFLDEPIPRHEGEEVRMSLIFQEEIDDLDIPLNEYPNMEKHGDILLIPGANSDIVIKPKKDECFFF